MLKTGDLEGALKFLDAQRAEIAHFLGRPVDGVDLLVGASGSRASRRRGAAHEGTRRRDRARPRHRDVDAGAERARAKRRNRPSRRSRKNSTPRSPAIAKFAQEKAANDVDYKKKEEILLKRSSGSERAFRRISGSRRSSSCTRTWSLPRPRCGTAAWAPPQPLRPNAAGGGKPKPRSMKEAIDRGLNRTRPRKDFLFDVTGPRPPDCSTCHRVSGDRIPPTVLRLVPSGIHPTLRATSMPFTTQEITDAGKIGLDFYLENNPVDQVAVERPLLKALQGRRSPPPAPSSTSSSSSVTAISRTSSGSTARRSSPTTSASSTTRRRYAWRSAHDGFALDEDRLAQNGIIVIDDASKAGNASDAERIQLTNLLEEQTEVLRLGFEEKFSQALHIDGTQSTDAIGGLDSLITLTPTTGTVGGIDRSLAGNVYWRNNVATGLTTTTTTGTIVSNMETQWKKCIRNGGQPISSSPARPSATATATSSSTPTVASTTARASRRRSRAVRRSPRTSTACRFSGRRSSRISTRCTRRRRVGEALLLHQHEVSAPAPARWARHDHAQAAPRV
jgi:hypothetical protein